MFAAHKAMGIRCCVRVPPPPLLPVAVLSASVALVLLALLPATHAAAAIRNVKTTVTMELSMRHKFPTWKVDGMLTRNIALEKGVASVQQLRSVGGSEWAPGACYWACRCG